MMDYNLSSRKLKPSTEKLKTLDIYGFDIETYGRENKFLMGSIANDKKEYVFWDKERMQTFVKGSNLLRGSTLFATNLAFDFLGLFDDLSKLHDFSYVVKGSEFMMITHRNKKHVVKFMDTMIRSCLLLLTSKQVVSDKFTTIIIRRLLMWQAVSLK